MPIVTISPAFEAVFINVVNEASVNRCDDEDYSDADSLYFDLYLDEKRQRIYLANGGFGYIPYLQIVTGQGDEASVEICATSDGDRVHRKGALVFEVEAAVAVCLSESDAAARTAFECWSTTL